MQEHSTTTTLNCDLIVFTPSQREAHIEKAIHLRKAAVGMEQSSSEIKIFFDPSTKPDEILAFAQDEQRCCSFLAEATVFRETVSGVDRVVLTMKTSPEGAAVWVGSFFSLAGPVEPNQSKGQSGSNAPVIKTSALVVAGLCLVCFLPFLGALLVARGLIPASWNPSEGVYLLTGLILVGTWFLWKGARKRNIFGKRDSSKSCGC